MHLGLCLDPGRPWSDVLTLAQRADEAGWRSVYVCDHFMPVEDAPDRQSPMLEAWSVLAALAARTERVRLGTLVLGNAYRHPAVVANMAATLDHVSAGRVVLGVGAGWQPNEHEAYGVPLLDAGARLDRFAEACEVMVGLLRHPPVSFRGTYYTLQGATCSPQPVQSPLPLLVGGGGERRTLKIAARWADEWHAWADPALFRHKSSVLEAYCADLGRDPAQVSRLTGQVVRVTDDADVRLPHEDGSDVVGPVGDVVERLEEYRDAGVDEFVVRDHGQTPLSAMLTTVDALASR